MQRYILKDKKAYPCDDMDLCSQNLIEGNYRVADTYVGTTFWVSTVFLGLDHQFGRGGPPMLFETMIFGDPLDGEMLRCSTWEQAETQHAAMVERVKKHV